ncbi:hypothetical protein [Komagataeibacter diospyri]|uniref:Phage protein n=1 Tax=Komagataeibacter diospyri TaxID=1932662 RepID=A0A4P5NSH5_9PROT|nr:hypothetical protein [Komagataeibacter diospyri]GCE82505.1 hypothetical protein MSKU9_0646 [Komagataeibacter diospyri]GCE89346.1 hypothetical protein MSKU15_0947 [Komagataeibacter diospyri]
MSAKPFNIGRDCRVVLVYDGSRVDLPTITGFTVQQRTHQLTSNPLNDMPMFYDVPGGWSGQFTFQRDGAGADDLFTAIESGFWSAGTVVLGSIYQYLTECDGSLSTYEFVGASLQLSDAGHYQSEMLVSQTITFAARARNRIS